MNVKEILPDSEWEETHRGRKWLSIDEAVDLVKEPSMQPMIKSLGDFIERDVK